VGLVALTSLSSIILEALSGGLGPNLLTWLSFWLSDFSSDLLTGALLLFAIHRLWRALPLHLSPPPSETSFIDAKEIRPEGLVVAETAPELLQAQKRAVALNELQTSPNAETRQALLRRLAEEGFALQQLPLIDIDLSGADLRGLDLSGANLSKAKLRAAKLAGANLQGAHLDAAQLIEADLRGADLRGASLERAYLSGADLGGARLGGARLICSLWRVNLVGADLEGADLSGAELFHTDLSGANLRGIRLGETKINSQTRLPDGQTWTAASDLARFTDPTHPQFWPWPGPSA
jgi:uncharacterized protein YjbI with pentapeptide repeats